MNHSRTILLKSQRLKHEIISIWWYICINICQSVGNTIWPKDIRIGFLTNLALKLFPCIRYKVLLFLLYHLLLEPEFEAFVMDVTYRTVALTRIEQWILSSGGIVPTNLALNIRIVLWINYATINLNCFFFEFFIEWIEWVVIQKLLLWSLVRTSNFPTCELIILV